MKNTLRYLSIALILFCAHASLAQSTRKKVTPKADTPAKATTQPTDSVQKPKSEPPKVDFKSEEPLRKEFQAQKSSEKYYIVPAGKSGVNIFFPSSDKKGGMAEWNWNIYNNQFEEVAKKTFTVSTKLDYNDYYYDEGGNHIYMLFGNQEKRSSFPALDGYTGKFEIIDLDVEKQTTTTISGQFMKKMHLNVFKAINGQIYLGGSVVPTLKQVNGAACVAMLTCFIGGKKRFDVFPHLLRIDSKGVKEIKLPITKQGEVLSIEYDTTSKKIFCIAFDAPMPTDRNLMICELGTGETGSKPIVLKPNSNNYYLNAQIQTISPTEKIIIGSYFKKDPKSKMLFGIGRKTNEALPPSTGFFFLKMSNTKQDFVQFYPFSKFTDVSQAINSVSKGKEKKIQKITAGLNMKVLPHKLIQRGDQWIMIADAYHGEYHTETTTSYVNGKMQTTSHTYFDGWRFDFSLVAGFDNNGDMKWNTTFPLSTPLTYSLKEQTKILENQGDNRIVMVYSYNGEIKSQVLDGETLEESSSSTKIFTGSDSDKIKSSTGSGISYWYDNYFIAYGYQKIAGKDAKNKKDTRAVFYLNKVSYR